MGEEGREDERREKGGGGEKKDGNMVEEGKMR